MSYRDYLLNREFPNYASVPVDEETGELFENEFVPAVPLSEQIHSMHNGGLPLHPLGEAVYDEDDSTEVDPANRFGVDSFEYHEALSARAKQDFKSKRKAAAEAAKAAEPAPPAPASPAPPAPAGK